MPPAFATSPDIATTPAFATTPDIATVLVEIAARMRHETAANPPGTSRNWQALTPGALACRLPLNARGNSKLGTQAIEMLARRMGWSVFG